VVNRYTVNRKVQLSGRTKTKYKFHTNETFKEINKWFYSNFLVINYDKTYFMQFAAKTGQEINMQVSSGDRRIATARSLKFLGSTINTSLTWRHHISEPTSRLNKTCYVIRSIKPFMSIDVLRSTYFSYVRAFNYNLWNYILGKLFPWRRHIQN
jgi:hypothetical protein